MFVPKYMGFIECYILKNVLSYSASHLVYSSQLRAQVGPKYFIESMIYVVYICVQYTLCSVPCVPCRGMRCGSVVYTTQQTHHVSPVLFEDKTKMQDTCERDRKVIFIFPSFVSINRSSARFEAIAEEIGKRNEKKRSII